MKIIQDVEFGYDLSAYSSYLEGLAGKMPRGSWDFANAPWHYDMSHHQCPHDSWLEFVTMAENGEGERSENRILDIQARFLGAYHDLFFEITYKNVSRYSMSLLTTRRGSEARIGHGDWIVDEILYEGGMLSHEIIFSDSGTWLIECEDMVYSCWPAAAKT